MKITEISEYQGGNTAVFSFARMNPPTIGHQKLINKVVSESQALSCPYFIMISKSFDKKKNPLPYDIKIDFIKQCFPSVKFMDDVTIDVEGSSKAVKTPFELIKFLCQGGYRNVVMVVGEDRVENFENMITPYIGNELDLDSFKVISAGQRTGDDEGSKASGTLVRQLANMGMKEEFDQFIPSNDQDLKDRLYNALKT